MQELLTVAQVADYLHVHKNTVYEFVKEDKIKAVKLGRSIRIKKGDYEEFVDRGTQEKIQRKDILPVWKNFLDGSGGCDSIDPEGDSGLKKLSETRWHCGERRYNYLRKTKQGIERFYVDYFKDGKRVQHVVKDARTPEEAAIALYSEYYGGSKEKTSSLQITEKNPTFEELADVFLSEYSMVEKRSWKTDRYCLKYSKQFFKMKYGILLAEEITPQKIRNLRAWLKNREVSVATINRFLAILRKMYYWAIDEGYLEKNPVSKVKISLKDEKPRTRIMNRDERTRLLDAIEEEHLLAFIIVSENTGLRKGDVLNLKWDNIDLDNMVITVVASKTGGTVVIPINSDLYEELLRLRNGERKSEYLNPDSEYLFFNPRTGKPLGDVKRSFNTTCKKAGIENLRIYDLRRTVGTLMNASGTSPVTTSKSLGHSSLSTTIKHYIHPDLEQKREAFERLVNARKAVPASNGALLHGCDTGHEKKKDTSPSYWFSMN